MLEAPWPNGKASLSGGEDCGFESHRCRTFLFFFSFCSLYITFLTSERLYAKLVSESIREFDGVSRC